MTWQNTLVRALATLVAAAAACLATASARAADDWPARPLRVVVPYPPGGVADRLARDVAAALQVRLGQPVIVENKSGASGNIGFESVARSPADGHTLVLAPASNLTIQKALFKHLAYDPERDFVPVSLLVQTPQVLVVHPSVDAGSVAQFVELARRRPGTTNFGVVNGAFQHIAGEMFKSQARTDSQAIAYQGPAPALNDLLGGQIQFMFTEAMNALEYVKAGKLKALAVTSRTRFPSLPDVPTMTELGYADFDVATWYAIVVRQGTPQPLVDRLSGELRAIVSTPAFRSRYEGFGAASVGSTPGETAAFVHGESVRWTALVKRFGVTPE